MVGIYFALLILSSGGGSGEDGLEGGVFEEADLDADGDDLAEVSGSGQVFAADAEVGETEVAVTGELKARGEDGGVKIDDGAELDFQVELNSRGGDGFAIEYPAAAFGEGGGKRVKDGVAFFVAETLDVERLHGEGAFGRGWR